MTTNAWLPFGREDCTVIVMMLVLRDSHLADSKQCPKLIHVTVMQSETTLKDDVDDDNKNLLVKVDVTKMLKKQTMKTDQYCTAGLPCIGN